jgi:uncharacterized protein YecT (DUF1311 family)
MAQGVPRDATTARGDWATLAGCLQESGDAPRACIGTVAVLCQTRQRGGNRNDVELACNARESAVWRERLDAAVATLRDRLEPEARTRFLAIQRDWETYVARKCAVMAEVNPSPSSALSASRCELREFAHRATDVDSLARSPSPGKALTR